MKRTKRLLPLLLSFALAVTMFPLTVLAAEPLPAPQAAWDGPAIEWTEVSGAEGYEVAVYYYDESHSLRPALDITYNPSEKYRKYEFLKRDPSPAVKVDVDWEKDLTYDSQSEMYRLNLNPYYTFRPDANYEFLVNGYYHDAGGKYVRGTRVYSSRISGQEIMEGYHSDYTVSFDANGGSGAMYSTTVREGEWYVLPKCTLTPPEGKEFRGWYTTSTRYMLSPGDAIEITGDTTIHASWADKALANPFVDVSEGDEYYEAVLWAYYAKPQITTGTDATHFSPKNTVKRCESVTFLWRAMGEPEPKSMANPFSDVKEKDYFYKPVLWAVENNITKGTTATTFAPNDTLSTAHMITFLYRTKNPGKDGWYEEAANWAGIGYDGKPFGVNTAVNNSTNCPRGYVVMFLKRAE